MIQSKLPSRMQPTQASLSLAQCLGIVDRCIFIAALCGVVFNLAVFSLLHSWAVHDVRILDPSGGWNDLLASPVFDTKQIKGERFPLEFVHITKTAGSAIEESAARSGVKWGVCHWKRVNNFGPMCMYKDWEIKRPAYNRSAIPFKFKGSLGEPWHTPPHWFKRNPYNGTATFCIVRDPYDRTVSEFYSKFGGYRGNDRNNVTVMNRWIQKQLAPRMKRTLHMLPQHMYVYNMEGEQMIDHVLRYERLDEDFGALMKQFRLDVDLPRRLNVRNATSSMLMTANLTEETIRVINAYYDDDFRLLNYTTVTSAANLA